MNQKAGMKLPVLSKVVEQEQKVWSIDEAFRYCQRLARTHYENFPVASLLIPSDKRRHVAAIYAFARIADDFADEPGLTPAERIDCLNDWEEQLFRCYQGTVQHPAFVALRQTVERFDIPLQLFRDLLTAFRSDVTTHRYGTFEDVLAYCRHSANPIGRLILLLFNYRSEAMMEKSDAICTALQLANFWQDISVDLQKNRVYIPLQDLATYRYSEEDLFSRKYNLQFRELLSFEIQRTLQLFQVGKPLLTEVGTDLSFQLKLTWLGGRKILEKIQRLDYNVLAQRPTLSIWDKTMLLTSSLTL